MNIEDVSFSMIQKCQMWKTKYIDLDNYMKDNIFHYTNIISLESIIKNKTLWITKSDFLNDRTEFVYAIDLIKRTYSKCQYENLSKGAIKTIIKILKSFINRSFIFSSSLNKDSVNLWGNYSKYEGYNIDFNLEKIFQRMWDGEIFVIGNGYENDFNPVKHMIPRKDQYETIGMLAGKVIYERKLQEEIIEDILSFINKTYEEYYDYLKIMDEDIEETERNYKRINFTFNSIISTAVDVLSNQIQLFKDPVFSQDEEYRIIFNINNKLDVIKYRASNGVFIPYIELKFESEFGNKDNRLPIDGITIGPKNNLDIAEKGLKLFLENQGYNAIYNNYKSDKNKIYI